MKLKLLSKKSKNIFLKTLEGVIWDNNNSDDFTKRCRVIVGFYKVVTRAG